jgi:Spy/CpxP family protein refolding chaperone
MKSRLAMIVAVLLGLSVAPAIAQNPQGPPMGGMGQGRGMMGQRRMQMLLTGITLTPVQQAKIDSIQTVYRAQMPAFTPGERPDSAARAQRMELLRKQDAEIRGVLTAEQQPVWDKNVADMQANMMNRRPGGQ